MFLHVPVIWFPPIGLVTTASSSHELLLDSHFNLMFNGLSQVVKMHINATVASVITISASTISSTSASSATMVSLLLGHIVQSLELIHIHALSTLGCFIEGISQVFIIDAISVTFSSYIHELFQIIRTGQDASGN